MDLSVICMGMQPVDAKNLIIEAKRGDSRAFATLYELFFTPVFRYVYARTWNTELSEDIAQTTFVKAWHGIHNWQERGKEPLAYFFTIARNTLLDHWRAKSSAPATDEELERIAGASRMNNEREVDRGLIAELLRQALEHVSSEQRDVVTMRYFGELEYTEIALALGKSEDAVRQLHSRAIKQLRVVFPEFPDYAE